MQIQELIKAILEMTPKQRELINQILEQTENKPTQNWQYKIPRKHSKVRRYTMEQLLQGQDLRKKGYKAAKIARITGIKQASVYKIDYLIKQKQNHSQPKPRVKWTTEKITKYLEEKAKGKTNAQLIKEGMPRTITSQAFRNKVKKQIDTIPALERFRVY